jgi:deazaflavin-dependent oxidoreductase (nitroreductase family)
MMEIQPVPKPDFLSDEQWAMVLQSRSRAVQGELGRSDAELYKKTGGKGGKFESLGGTPLVITVIGRKSGKELTTMLFYMPDDENFVIVGSCAGLPEDPHWWKNLQANPHAWVQVNDRRFEVTARKATAEERARLWPRIEQKFPLWGHFQKHVEREFPVVILSPVCIKES